MIDSTHNFGNHGHTKHDPHSHKSTINTGMAGDTHFFDPHNKKDPKGVVDKLHMLDRIIERNESMLMSSGSPMTLWKFYPYGPECTCKDEDSRCELCYGSGYLNGYQKYGYVTYTFGFI